jgi:predicted neutral ceramidase superfamily lipid hydrolase
MKKESNMRAMMLLMIYTSILAFILKPYLQNTLNMNFKDSGFIVIVSFIIGALAIIIIDRLIKKNKR